jgi:hypothetical protein
MLFKPNNCMNKLRVELNLACVINNHTLIRVHCVKYLSVWLEDKLNWSHHIDALIKKVRSLTGILYRKKYAISLQCRKTLYFSLIYSISSLIVLKPMEAPSRNI